MTAFKTSSSFKWPVMGLNWKMRAQHSPAEFAAAPVQGTNREPEGAPWRYSCNGARTGETWKNKQTI